MHRRSLLPPCLFTYCVYVTAFWLCPSSDQLLLTIHVSLYFFKKYFYFSICFIFSCAGSSLLHGPFSGCGGWGLPSSCGAQASHCCGFSCCRAQPLGFAAPGFQRSTVVVHGLSCSVARGIFPDQGSNPCLLHCRFFPTEPPGKPSYSFCVFVCMGLHYCAWAFSSCVEQRLLFIAAHGFLIAVASLVAEHRLQAHSLQ